MLCSLMYYMILCMTIGVTTTSYVQAYKEVGFKDRRKNHDSKTPIIFKTSWNNLNSSSSSQTHRRMLFGSLDLPFVIRSRDSGLVITAALAPPDKNNYRRLQIQPYSPGNPNQLWFYDESTSHLHLNLTHCMQGNTLDYCDYSNVRQQWFYYSVGIWINYDDDGQIYVDSCLGPYEKDPTTTYAIITPCTNSKKIVWDIDFPQGFPSDQLYSIQNIQYNSQCIHVPSGNFVFQQLQLADCDGSLQQVWRRPSSDLRIQTNHYTCIDAYGNAGPGEGVYSNTCNEDDSQKWLYDGTYLRPRYNTSLCLSATVLESNKLLILDLCSEATPQMQWAKQSLSSTTLAHIGEYGGRMDMFRCPNNTGVSGITGNYGFFLHQIIFTCEDGSTNTFGQETGGDPATDDHCNGGYSQIEYNNLIDSPYMGDVNFYCYGEKRWMGSFRRINGPSTTGIVSCPLGQIIIGFNVWWGWIVDGLEAICDTVIHPTSARPTAIRPSRPSAKPTVKPWSPTTSPTIQPTLTDGSHPIQGRYIKLARVHVSPLGWADDYIHILGIDAYDENGSFISDKSTPYVDELWSDLSDVDNFGPQYLNDGIHQAMKPDGSSWRMAHSYQGPDRYMQLDFGKDVIISNIVLWNRIDVSAYSRRLIGCALLVINDANTTIFYQLITRSRNVYEWEFGPRPPKILRSTMGPILSLTRSWKCVQVIGASFKVGNELTVSNCNSSPEQQWSRYGPIDLQLQTLYNLCMDVPGMMKTGNPVVLSKCDSSRLSQIWVYSSRNLHPKANLTLCLSIKENNEVDDEPRLIVSSCDDSLNNLWGDYSNSSLSGEYYGGDTFGHYLCPDGSKVINISGRGGFYVNQIVMACDDDNRTILGPVGGTDGTPVLSPDCTSGYTTVSVTPNVGKVSALCSGSPSLSVSIGSAEEGSNLTNTLMLQGKQRIIGMQVYAGDFVDSLGFLYTSIQKADLPSRPSTRPSIRPSVWPRPWMVYESQVFGKISSNLTMGYGACPKGYRVVSIDGMSSDWIYHLSATCNDKNSTRLGPWGNAINTLEVVSISCPEGCNGWNITYGSRIGQLSFSGALSSPFLGRGLALGAGTNDRVTLKNNQHIVGFRLYHSSQGIHAIRMQYADFPSSADKCFDFVGAPTGRCPTKFDWLAILWGSLTFAGVSLVVGWIVLSRRRKQRKRIYKKRDEILPLK